MIFSETEGFGEFYGFVLNFILIGPDFFNT